MIWAPNLVDYARNLTFKVWSKTDKNSKWVDIALLLILTLLPCLFFWRLLTPNPADHMQIATGDFTEQYFPLRAFTAQQWVRGQIPLWNPYLYGGQPGLADIQAGALYPPHILEALLLGWGGPLSGREIGFPLWALELQVIAHFSLAALGTYGFAHHLARHNGITRSRARFGGVIAALVFTYSGYLTGFPVQQMTILAVSAWLPWILWGISASLSQRGGAPANFSLRLLSPALSWGALAFALAILAGHPQTVLYIFYLSLAYTIFRAWWAWRVSEPAHDDRRRQIHPSSLVPVLASYLVCWLVIMALGAAMAAAQLLPTLEFIANSLRTELTYQAVSGGLPLTEFIAIIYPGFLGGSPQYVGIGSLVLIGLALVLAQPRPEIAFWSGAGLVSLLLAFGGNTFLYPLFYLVGPGFDAVRQQERAFLVYSFSAAMLAGFGAMALAGPLPRVFRQKYALFERRLRLIAGIMAGLTGLFIYGSAAATAREDPVNLFFGVLQQHVLGLIILGGMLLLLGLRPRRRLRRTWGMSLVALWLGFNLFTVNWRFNLEKPGDPVPFRPNGVVRFLQTNLAAAQVTHPSLSAGRIVSGGLLPGGNSAASVYELPDLTGNTPLQLAAVDNFLQRMPVWRAWQLLNVRYVIEQRDIADPGLARVFEEDDLKVFEMGDPFPRAWFVSDTEVISSADQALTRLAADDFDLRRTAITAGLLGLPLAAAKASTVTLVDSGPTHLRAELEATGRQLVVFSQIYYPGWQAAVDGQPTPLHRVNVILQGVVTPPGKHTVQLTFSPASFWWGSVISMIGIVGWGVMLVWFYLLPLAWNVGRRTWNVGRGT